MKLGYGFVVEISDEKTKRQLMKLFKKRIENYPIICKLPLGNIRVGSRVCIKCYVPSFPGEKEKVVKLPKEFVEEYKRWQKFVEGSK